MNTLHNATRLQLHNDLTKGSQSMFTLSFKICFFIHTNKHATNLLLLKRHWLAVLVWFDAASVMRSCALENPHQAL